MNLELQLDFARKRLQKIWNSRGVTDALVLAAGAEFDAILNEYLRLQNLSSRS